MKLFYPIDTLGVLTLLLFCNTPVLSQIPFSGKVPLSQSIITQWTGDNGLISNNITSAVQVKTGFIWITTYNGIMRFDGKKVDVYDRSNIPFLSTDSFYGAYEDEMGTLWFASQGSGLVKYADKKFTAIDREGKILPKSIRCLLIQKGGVRWIGTNSGGLFKMENESIQKIDYAEFNTTGILDIIADPSGSIWVATDGNGLVKYDGKKFMHYTVQDGLLSNNVDAIQSDVDGNIWIGTTNGLNLLSDGKISKVKALKNFQINEILIDKQNTVWVGCELGLARISTDQTKFEFLSEQDGYPLSRINAICFDNEHSLWVSTGRNGLIQLKESHIANITTSEGLNTNKTNIIIEGPNNSYYIGSDAGVVDIYNNGIIRKLPIKTSLTDAGIRDIIVENEQTIWIASYRGVLKVENEREKLFTIADGLPANDVRRIIKDDEGYLWIATRSGGIAKMQNDRVVSIFDKSNHLKSNYILSLTRDSQGSIYVGTHSGGLSVIKKDGSVVHYPIQADDSGMLIFNIHVDDHGHVKIVTNIGPYYLDGSTFKKIPLDNTSKGETYFDWIEDGQGSVWITTNIGILKLSQQQVEDFIAGNITSIKTRLYDNQDGMKSKECTGATRSLLSSAGKVWVPTIGGICIIHPEKVTENKLLPPVYITSLLVDDRETDTEEELEIEPGKLRFRFNFTAPSFIAPGKIRFQYKLEPVDQDWITSEGNRQAEYTNLSPGRYIFHVKASNSDGLWNEQEANLPFFVKPFFYQTIWFYVTIILVTISGLYALYRWRVYEVEHRNQELRKVNNELDRFVYSASHDLRAPLASILGLVNVARIDKGGNMDDYLDKIEKSVNKLDGFVKDIIDFSRNARTAVTPEQIIFEPLIHDVIDDLKYLDDKNQIKRMVSVTGSGVFKTDKKRLTIVLSNLISNAIKYFNPHITDAFIEVTVEYSSEKATIRVRDNGIGIAQEHVDNIFKMFYRGDTKSRGSGLGLYIVKETIEKIGGTIDVHSVYSEGSTFTITIPSLLITQPAMGNAEEND